ncbi:hypothetical protein BSIN_4963 [Burkholderia singularis]|uniref:Uncharacterized protein n=1 Tax=Burkholderia singularis TaxID=1503053 RepID=A0A238HCI8_9BURK|nr:hypothetical protein BSIN_4963 [Burkholderia singularis]
MGPPSPKLQLLNLKAAKMMKNSAVIIEHRPVHGPIRGNV